MTVMTDAAPALRDSGCDRGYLGSACAGPPAGRRPATRAASGGPDPFDALTRELAGATSRREALRRIAAAGGALLLAQFGIGCDKGSPTSPEHECGTASVCGERHYCSDDEQCLCIRSAEGVRRCGRIPSCSVRTCKTSADCADLGEGYFCDSPGSGCCSDEDQYCIAPCQSPRPPDPPATGLFAASGSSRDVLFFYRSAEQRIFYQGRQSGGSYAVSHATVEVDGEAQALVFSEDYHPIQWIMDGVSVQARRQPGESAFDPRNALLLFADGERASLTLDLYPSDLNAIIDRLEALTGETFSSARRFLQTTASTYSQILSLARTPAGQQARAIGAAVAFSTAAAALAMNDAAQSGTAAGTAALTAAPPISGAAKLALQMGASLMGSVIGDTLNQLLPQDPNAPQVDVLLCQGASIIPQICHYMYFLNKGSPFPCLDVCLTSLGCFTGICQPMTLDWDSAEEARRRS